GARRRTHAAEQGGTRVSGRTEACAPEVSGACRKKLGFRTSDHAGTMQWHGTGISDDQASDDVRMRAPGPGLAFHRFPAYGMESCAAETLLRRSVVNIRQLYV